MKVYRRSRLAEILGRSQVPVQISPEETYKQVTVRLFHKGVVLRGLQQGGSIRSRQWRVRAGQVLLSRIDARNGAIGLVPSELDGAIVTNDFWAFNVNLDLTEPKYLDLYFGTRQFVEDCQRASEGTTNRVRVQPVRFLQIEVPLAPISEQRRIVARIEELSAKIEEARTLRLYAAEQAEALVAAEMHRLFLFDEAITSVGDFARVQGGFAFPSGNYDETGTHQLVRIGNVRDGYLDLGRAPVRWNPAGDARILKYELKPRDLVISMTGTREKRDYGFIAKVPENSSLLLNQRVGRFVIHREIDHDYLFHFLRSPFFRDRLFPSATGTANQANIGNGDIEKIKFAPAPPPEQRRIVAHLDNLQAKVDSLKELQAKSDSELNALMPSILREAFMGTL